MEGSGDGIMTDTLPGFGHTLVCWIHELYMRKMFFTTHKPCNCLAFTLEVEVPSPGIYPPFLSPEK